VEILFTKFVVSETQLLMLVQNPVVIGKSMMGKKEKSYKSVCQREEN